jgi:hypothetical protein
MFYAGQEKVDQQEGQLFQFSWEIKDGTKEKRRGL